VGAADTSIPATGGNQSGPITDDQTTRFISNYPDIAKHHILPCIPIAQLHAQESFDWFKQLGPALPGEDWKSLKVRPTNSREERLYNKITSDLDIKKNTLSTEDFENYITHFLVAYTDILCKNRSEEEDLIIRALVRCKTKYNIQAVVPTSSRTPEYDKACTSMKDIIENSVNRVMASGESSIADDMDKFRQFLAENKNVLFLGYADELVESGREWDNTLREVIDSKWPRSHYFAKFDKQQPIGKLYNEMLYTVFVYQQLLLNRPALSY
jgi:hypothetical protein